LLASSQEKVAWQPATYYDFRQLVMDVRKLEADVVPAKLTQNMESAENLNLQNNTFGDIEKICDEVKGSCEENESKISALQDQIENFQIGCAIFALSALSLSESDRRDCLSRLKDKEERMRRAKASSESSVNSSPRSRRSRLSATSSGVVTPPC